MRSGRSVIAQRGCVGGGGEVEDDIGGGAGVGDRFEAGVVDRAEVRHGDGALKTNDIALATPIASEMTRLPEPSREGASDGVGTQLSVPAVAVELTIDVAPVIAKSTPVRLTAPATVSCVYWE